MNYGYKVTTKGRELLAALLSTGAGLEITRVAVGSGKVAEDQELADMTDLIQYVADGTIAQRRHEENMLYLMVQYSSNYTPGLGAFYLAEFIVEARHPVSGESVPLLYATLGDYIQPVNAYSDTQAPDIRQYPIVLVLSDEISVTISTPAGLVTYDDLAAAVQTACEDLLDTLAVGGIKKSIDFSIPADAWVEDATAENGYTFRYDLIDADTTKNMIPYVVVAEASLETAGLAGMCPTATSYSGYTRLKCKQRPEADIDATCHLLVRGAISSGSGTIDPDSLPVATADTAGLIKASDSLTVDADGTAHAVFGADALATDEEMTAAYDDIYGTGAGASETP